MTDAPRPWKPGQLLYFAKDGDEVLPPERARERWKFNPDGVNFYYGLNAAGFEHFRRQGSALRENHRRFFDLVKRTLASTDRERFLVNLGLWPFEPGSPYEWVEEHAELARRLAEEIGALQQEIARTGKRLDLVVRYASEMNDPLKPGHWWGRPHGPWDPAHAQPYQRTFRLVRGLFRETAPRVRFAFSPALRSDITGNRYDMIQAFWPGKEWVDTVSATWYVGQAAQLPGAVAVLERYVQEMLPHRLPFGLDEIGGSDGEGGNDAVLQEMLAALATLQRREPNLTFDYVTLFLHGRWAADATLTFLTQEDAG